MDTSHHALLPDLVLLGVEVEVDLPLGLEDHLTGTDGTGLVVGERLHGHHVGVPAEVVKHVQLDLVLPLLLPGHLRHEPLDPLEDPEARAQTGRLVVPDQFVLLDIPPGESKFQTGEKEDKLETDLLTRL